MQLTIMSVLVKTQSWRLFEGSLMQWSMSLAQSTWEHQSRMTPRGWWLIMKQEDGQGYFDHLTVCTGPERIVLRGGRVSTTMQRSNDHSYGNCIEGSLDMAFILWFLRGSHNDLNVLSRTPLFSRLITGEAPACNYSVNVHNYSMGYYLMDGIYPPWSTLVKKVSRPKGNKKHSLSPMSRSG